MEEKLGEDRPFGDFPDGRKGSVCKAVAYEGRCDITFTRLPTSEEMPGEPDGRPLAEIRGVPFAEAVEFLVDLLMDHVAEDAPFEDLIAGYDGGGRRSSAAGS